eukprot:m.56018 g.56018  ORF g.56018 m.56018 type:complete len:80 (-) comp22170_c0_seq1:80-319(-)
MMVLLVMVMMPNDVGVVCCLLAVQAAYSRYFVESISMIWAWVYVGFSLLYTFMFSLQNFCQALGCLGYKFESTCKSVHV